MSGALDDEMSTSINGTERPIGTYLCNVQAMIQYTPARDGESSLTGRNSGSSVLTGSKNTGVSEKVSIDLRLVGEELDRWFGQKYLCESENVQCV